MAKYFGTGGEQHGTGEQEKLNETVVESLYKGDTEELGDNLIYHGDNKDKAEEYTIRIIDLLTN